MKITIDDQKKATQMILAYIKHLRSRAALDRMDPNYLNPSSIPNRIKPIKKLLEMNGLGWAGKESIPHILMQTIPIQAAATPDRKSRP